MDDPKTIETYFRAKSIFITGATGFVGKILIEKLLRSFDEIETIYVLIRKKDKETPTKRLQKLIDCSLFNILKTERPQTLQKLKVIPGDITEAKLGISESDMILLRNKVNVVFHAAATVRFDEDLKIAIEINLLGTQKVVEFCKQLENLEALVHVSTAYSNCNRSEVEEKIYPVPYTVDKIVQSTYWMNEELIAEHTAQIIGSWPNTYTFTKALAEHVVSEVSSEFPVSIVRPSIILSTVTDPVPGWIESWNGPTGIVSAASKGVYNSFFCHRWAVVDMIPADIVVNVLICAAWATATKKSKDTTIYNCCTGAQNPLKWGDFISQCLVHVRRNPSERVFWYPKAHAYSNRFLYNLGCFFRHVFPAYLMDSMSLFLKSKIKLVPIQKRLSKASKAVEYFTTREWHFKNENFIKLNKALTPEDRKRFCFDVRTIEWSSYLENYVLGIRKHIFGESDCTIPKARQMLIWYKWAHRVTRFALVIFILKIGIGKNAANFILDVVNKCLLLREELVY
ncbi:putative fatty acyl-CoA reductase CG5065 [Planococcus citri]|uniref:putative fatty acyl-CoA reductase CG5065 n=1 Tax=Planococcus citri TaxID=170843 RepID=UPI0031F94814